MSKQFGMYCLPVVLFLVLPPYEGREKSATKRPCRRGPKTTLGLGTRIREGIGVGIGTGNCIGIGKGYRLGT